jgi:hypothetical protein
MCNMMANQTGDWRELCKKVAREYDPEKLLDLMSQINRALSHQREKLMEARPNGTSGPFGGAFPKIS